MQMQQPSSNWELQPSLVFDGVYHVYFLGVVVYGDSSTNRYHHVIASRDVVVAITVARVVVLVTI